MCERKIALPIDNVQTIAIQSVKRLPIFLEEEISFQQFIANEKCNLQSFHSFKTKQMKFDARNDNERLIKYVLGRSCIGSKNISSTSSIENCFYDQRFLSNKQKQKSLSHFLDSQPTYARNKYAIKPVYCVERHVDYMNDKQIKAARRFIQQLNTYIQQKMSASQEHSNRMSHFKRQTKTFDQRIENNTNENVDLSEQLLYDYKTSSNIYLNRNNNLLKFYESSRISNLDFDNTIISVESNDISSDKCVHHSQTTENQAILSKSNLDKTYSTIVPLSLFKLSNCVNREQYSVNLNEFPWSSDRKSRMTVYRKVRSRFTRMTLIDVDISILFRNILRSFHTEL